MARNAGDWSREYAAIESLFSVAFEFFVLIGCSPLLVPPTAVGPQFARHGAAKSASVYLDSSPQPIAVPIVHTIRVGALKDGDRQIFAAFTPNRDIAHRFAFAK